jgi:hypothetical protein
MGFTQLQIQRNSWLGGYPPQILFSLPSVLNCWTPPPQIRHWLQTQMLQSHSLNTNEHNINTKTFINVAFEQKFKQFRTINTQSTRMSYSWRQTPAFHLKSCFWENRYNNAWIDYEVKSASYWNEIKLQVKVKFTVKQATKAHRGSRSIAPLFLQPRRYMERVVNATPRPLCPMERPSTHCIGELVGPRAGLDGCGKSRPYRDSIPGPSSPYRVEKLTELSRHTERYKFKIIWPSISNNDCKNIAFSINQNAASVSVRVVFKS